MWEWIFAIGMSRQKPNVAQTHQWWFPALVRATCLQHTPWRLTISLPSLLGSFKPKKSPEELSRAQLLWLQLLLRTHSCPRHRTNFLYCSSTAAANSFNSIMFCTEGDRKETQHLFQKRNFTFFFIGNHRTLLSFPRKKNFLDRLWGRTGGYSLGAVGGDGLVLFLAQRNSPRCGMQAAYCWAQPSLTCSGLCEIFPALLGCWHTLSLLTAYCRSRIKYALPIPASGVGSLGTTSPSYSLKVRG